ncbi:MAG TPA: TadE/TadG family type IV pilus assembly protein [Candidatus Dormibacteraeota bacterium]|nr:TadE/TadG family type IV pilus assembly protein [Candidatus Dormibacteraeota bacterium]
MRRIRAYLQSGQATVELAIVGPVLLGLFALTLQGGVVISDQVNLQQDAYEGAQWAMSNRTTATLTGSGSTSITQHVQDQLCGSGKAIGASDAITRICRTGGVTITVTSNAATARSARPSDPLTALGLVDNAEAAVPACPNGGVNPWSLAVTQSGGVVTATMTGPNGTGSPSGSAATPVVTLVAMGLPTNTSGTPLWNPPVIGTSAQLAVQGSYNMKVTGVDQCGGQEAQGPRPISSGGSPATTVGIGTPVPHVDGVTPSCIHGATTLTINGQGFASGATVAFDYGFGAATFASTFISSTQITVSVPAPSTSDTDNVVVTNPGGTKAKLYNAVLNSPIAACPAGTGNVSGSSTPCNAAGGSGGGLEYTVKISWTETLIIPWITSGVGLSATERSFCQ